MTPLAMSSAETATIAVSPDSGASSATPRELRRSSLLSPMRSPDSLPGVERGDSPCRDSTALSKEVLERDAGGGMLEELEDDTLIRDEMGGNLPEKKDQAQDLSQTGDGGSMMKHDA